MKKLIKNTALIITGLVVGVMVGRCRKNIFIDKEKLIQGLSNNHSNSIRLKDSRRI